MEPIHLIPTHSFIVHTATAPNSTSLAAAQTAAVAAVDHVPVLRSKDCQTPAADHLFHLRGAVGKILKHTLVHVPL